MQEGYLGWEKVSCLEVSSVQECPHRERVVKFGMNLSVYVCDSLSLPPP